MGRKTVAILSGICLGAGLLIAGCFRGNPDEAVAEEIARSLIEACPPAAADDAEAHRASAEKLAGLEVLRHVMGETMLWGGHRAGRSYDPEQNHVTAFNPRVWRKLYLSLYQFPGPYRIELQEPYTVLHLSSRFREGLEPGVYPYPLWHSEKKWDNYQRAAEVLLILEKGQLIAGYRSAVEDAMHSHVARAWDGVWRWTSPTGAQMPAVTLYGHLFSGSNPHVPKLEAAYRALEESARGQNCLHCHSPDNVSRMSPLVLLNYPNQALGARHVLVKELTENKMPPADEDKGVPAGIADPQKRAELLELARAFAAAGDEALAQEGEPVASSR